MPQRLRITLGGRAKQQVDALMCSPALVDSVILYELRVQVSRWLNGLDRAPFSPAVGVPQIFRLPRSGASLSLEVPSHNEIEIRYLEPPP